VHKLNCMYQIWSHPQFYYRKHGDGKVHDLPLSIQAALKNTARSAMRSYEHDILKDLDQYVFQTPIKREDRLSVWASFWQVILINDDILRRIQLSKVDKSRREACLDLSRELLTTAAISYAGLFRSKTHLDQALTLVIGPALQNMVQIEDMNRQIFEARQSRNNFRKCPSTVRRPIHLR
jgi:hypothetical protein